MNPKNEKEFSFQVEGETTRKTDLENKKEEKRKQFTDTELDAIKQYRADNFSEDWIAWHLGCEVSDLPAKEAEPKKTDKALGAKQKRQ
jgi:hypothetical protein